MRPAEALFAASMMMSNSMMDVLTGEDSDWMTYTSLSRTLSSILTKMLSLENWKTSSLPRVTCNCSATASASAELAFSMNIVRSSYWDIWASPEIRHQKSEIRIQYFLQRLIPDC